MEGEGAGSGPQAPAPWRPAGAGAFATLLLLAMAILLALTHFWTGPEMARGLVRAGAEAAIVGGLADWFAVVALFRRPLGLPIPHTAVIARSKDRIATGLGQFVERHFLDPALVAGRIAAAGLTAQAARWLARPVNAGAIAGRLARVLPPLLAAVDDREVQALLVRALKGPFAAIDPAPLVGRALALMTAGPGNPLVGRLVAALRALLAEHREQVVGAVEERSRWWIPRRVDRSIAHAILAGMDELLAELAQPASPRRAAAEQALSRLIADLEQDAAYGERLRRLALDLLNDSAVQAYLGRLWGFLRQSLLGQGATPGAPARRQPARRILADALVALATALAADAALCRRSDRALGHAARRLAEPWRQQIGTFIADVVRGWEAADMAARIESAVGRDLHYIRINGTLVGAGIGCLLYLVQHFAG